MALVLAVALLSGLTVAQACRQVTRWLDGPDPDRFRIAVERHRLGVPLVDALDESLGESELARLVPLLRSYLDDGAPVGDAVVDLAHTVQVEHRRALELRARRLPVRMLLPMILFVLPGFLLLTVAPVIIESLRGVSF